METAVVGEGITTDGAGNVIVTGHFRGTVDLGGGPLTSLPWGFDPGDDILLLKLTAAGQHVFSRRFGDELGDHYGLGAATDGAGNIVLTGNLPGTADFGGGSVSGLGFLARFDPAGAHLHSRGFATARAGAVAVDPSGNAWIVGALFNTVDLGGGPITDAPPQGDDVFFAAFDPLGAHRRSGALPTRANGGFYSARVAVNASGEAWLASDFETSIDFGGGPVPAMGGRDVHVTKVSAAGQVLFGKRFGGAGTEQLFGLATDAAGRVVLAGGFMGTTDFGGGPVTSAGDNDVFLVELGPDLVHLSTQRFGGAGEDAAHALTVDAAGYRILAGRFAGTLDFGGGPFAGPGGFVAKFPP